MSEEGEYEISPRSGRLRRKVRFKKKKKTKSFNSQIKDFFNNPIFLFVIVIITGLFLYLTLNQPAKKPNKKRATPNSNLLNKRIKDNRTEE
jgi:hypothetical protein